jgi:hypothetical protein
MTKSDDVGRCLHGVSLSLRGSGRLDTRLDTPPSTHRRHPISRIARADPRDGRWLADDASGAHRRADPAAGPPGWVHRLRLSLPEGMPAAQSAGSARERGARARALATQRTIVKADPQRPLPASSISGTPDRSLFYSWSRAPTPGERLLGAIADKYRHTFSRPKSAARAGRKTRLFLDIICDVTNGGHEQWLATLPSMAIP